MKLKQTTQQLVSTLGTFRREMKAATLLLSFTACAVSSSGTLAADLALKELDPWLHGSITSNLIGENSVDGTYMGLGSPDGGSLANAMEENITISVRNTHETGQAAGMHLTTNAEIHNADIKGSISATAHNGKSYGIWMANSDVNSYSGFFDSYYSTFSGSISIKNEGNDTGESIGYATGRDLSDASMGLYNAETKSSEGFYIDWDSASFSVERVNGSSTGAVFYQDRDSVNLGGDFSATITGNGSAKALYLINSVMGDITGSITASSKGSESIGIHAQGGNLGNISSNITVTGNSGSETGIHLQGASLEAFSGNMSVSSDTVAYGIRTEGVTDSIAVSGSIALSMSSDQGGYSYGYLLGETVRDSSVALYNEDEFNSTGFDVDWTSTDLSVSRTQGRAIAVFIGTGENLPANSAIGGHIKAEVKENPKSMAVALYLRGDATVNTQAGAKIEAKQLGGHGTAIINEISGIRLTMQPNTAQPSLTTVEIYGNVIAGNHSLTFANGDYALDASNVMGSSIMIGESLTSGSYSTAKVQLSSSLTTITTQELSLTVNSLTDYSQLLLEAGSSLDTSAIKTVNVYLGDGFSLEEGESITLISGATGSFDLSGATFNFIQNGNADSYMLSTTSTSLNLTLDNAIPEPSTATLSLLALAGLCSRRRRKQAC